MARKPVVKAKEKSQLGMALDHAYLCAGGIAAYAPYCLFAPGWLIGYDGLVASGFKIAEDLRIAPHTETMRNAVAKAGNPFGLTQLPDGNVVVTGHKVRVEVPCHSLDAIPNVQPDAARHVCSEALREAIVDASKVTTARHARVIAAAVLLRSNSCVGTDGGTILEAHHGQELGQQFLIPTEFAQAIDKVKYKPTHCGWSDTTFTIWYGPNAWIRTNLYSDSYPDTDIIFARLMSVGAELRPIAPETLAALMTLKPFLDDHTITLWAGGLNTKPDGTGASFGLQHHLLVPQPRVLPYNAMVYAATWGEWMSFQPDGMFWYGNRVRGATAAAQ